jgi:hypothetical protein
MKNLLLTVTLTLVTIASSAVRLKPSHSHLLSTPLL